MTVGAKWPTTNLRFRFLNSTSDLAEGRQRDIVRESFQRWSSASALRFNEVAADQEAEISVAFHQGSHGDGEPFDDGGGPDGNTLAHAFFPPPAGGTFAGSLHFDEFEQWKDQPGGAGIRLFNVALHEIGHLLCSEREGRFGTLCLQHAVAFNLQYVAREFPVLFVVFHNKNQFIGHIEWEA